MSDKKIILAVDDMPENLTILRSMLKDFFDIRLAKSAKLALALLEKLRVDLILLDIEMPGISGFEFLKRLDVDGSINRETPIIFVTAHADRDFINEAINAGAKDYILKPVNARALHKKIEAVIGMPEIKTNPLEGNLKELMTAAIAADSAQAENLVKELLRVSKGMDDQICTPIDEIAKLIQGFDYEKGIRKIKDLLHNLSLNRRW